MKLRLFLKENLRIVIMGASAKVEERLFVKTNYFEELTNFFPKTGFSLYFVGPELSIERNNSTVVKNSGLKGSFYRSTVSDFVID